MFRGVVSECLAYRTDAAAFTLEPHRRSRYKSRYFSKAHQADHEPS